MTVLRRLGQALLVLTLLAATSRDTAQTWADRPVLLAFGGDVHFEGRVQRLLGDPASVFGSAGPVLAKADLAFVNLETPLTRRDEPEPKRYVFRAAPEAAEALRAAGVDAVSLANNHSMDHGRAGLADTVAAARTAGVGTFGAGPDIEAAFRPWRAEVRGLRVAVFGFSQVGDLAERWTAGPGLPGMAMASDTGRAVRAVAAARADSDLVVVMPHWGREGDPCPSRAQQEFAARLAEAGADVVVGAHAHVLQGAGHLGFTYVAYGLGNLLWYSAGLHPPFSARSGILTLAVRGRSVVRADLAPAVVSDTGRPRLLSGPRAAIARDNFARSAACAGLT